jgi:AmmeMemoRadiSam system protein B
LHVRWPSVAGQFYDADAQSLTRSIDGCFLNCLGPGRKPPPDRPIEGLIGLVSPHAGYMYSGPVAAHGYYACSTLSDLEMVVILGPNHHGVGSGVATVKGGSWRTPLGDVEVDGEAAKELVEVSGIVDFNEDAHQEEHSVEVQIPFLQFIYRKNFKILPVCMLMQDLDTAIEVGDALASVVRGRRSLLIASSDFTHYENHKSASSKDRAVIETILKLDVDRFYETIERLNVSICGFGPIASVMTASKRLGGQEGKLLKYATSGDVTGDFSAVVGYASIIFPSR